MPMQMPTPPRPLPWKEHTVALGSSLRMTIARWNDPRWIQVITLSVFAFLGQTVYHFVITPWQIAMAVLSVAIADFVLSWRIRGSLMFPTSGLISGLGIAMLLRPTSLEILAFLVAGLIASLSKYFVRYKGRHVFNPSNIALTVMLVCLPWFMRSVPAQWTPSPWLLLFIASMGLLVAYRARVLYIALLFIFLEFLLIFLSASPAFSRIPGFPPPSFVVSPAFLIFTFFMITDPATSPKTWKGRTWYVLTVTALHWLLLYMGFTQFALFLALSLACLGYALLRAPPSPERA